MFSLIVWSTEQLSGGCWHQERTSAPRQSVVLEQNGSAEMGTEQNGSIAKQREDNCLLLSGDGNGVEQLHGTVVARER